MDWFEVKTSSREARRLTARNATPALAVVLVVWILMVGWPRFDPEFPGPFPYTGTPLTAAARSELASGGWTVTGPDAPPWNLALTRPPAAGETRWLVYFGGNTPGYLAEAKSILLSLDQGRGLGLAAFAPPGFDGSPGEPSPEALRDSATNAMRWLVSTHPTAAQGIHLVGFSMGSMAALTAANTLHERETPARGLVLFAPFLRMKVRPSGFMGRVFGRHEYDNRPLLRTHRQRPTLVLHGGADSALPLLQGERVSRALAAPLKVYPDIGHADLLKHPPALAAARQGLGL
ncbi:alpha/beta hydrolase [Myxococcus sp. SDU36]|uniref:alpha/beta hydrolase family protein n=1 Tax=Myxococcus sp. SDU36 TaxID=2831967 RepID=UPI002543B12D|nr:alpha/beta hydrolase [Myxococcus sp. SDU36]